MLLLRFLPAICHQLLGPKVARGRPFREIDLCIGDGGPAGTHSSLSILHGSAGQQHAAGSGAAGTASGFVVRAQVNRVLVVDDADAYAIEPSSPAEHVLLNRVVSKEVNDRSEFDIQHSDGHLVPICSKSFHRSRKDFRVTRFDLEAQHFRLLPLEQAV